MKIWKWLILVLVTCIVSLCALGESVTETEKANLISGIREDEIIINSDYAEELSVTDLTVRQLMTIEAGYEGVITFSDVTIKKLVVDASDVGASNTITIILGKRARIEELVILGNACVIFEDTSARVEDVIVSGEKADAIFYGEYDKITVEDKAKAFIGVGAVVNNMEMESGCASRIYDMGVVNNLHILPTEDMVENPAFIDVNDGAELVNVLAAGMLDIGKSGHVENVETQLLDDFPYNEETEEKVVVNLCEEIRNNEGELTVTNAESDNTQINYVSRDYFEEREPEVFDELADDVELIALDTEFDIGGVLTKTYDGTTVQTVAVALTGVAEGDDVSCMAIITYADKNQGEGKRMQVEFRLAGADAGKYSAPPAQTSNSGVIDKRNVSMEYDDIVARDYIPGNKIVAVNNFRTIGILSGDKVYVSDKVIYAEMEDANAGVNKPLSFENIRLSGLDSKNYNLLYPRGKFITINKINQSTVSFTGSNADYNPLSPYALSYSGGNGEGAVSYEIVGGTGAGRVEGSSLNVDRCGTFDIKVSKAGDINYLDAESVVSTIQINKIEQEPISFTGAATADYNPDGAYPLSMTGGSGTGAVTYAIIGGTGTGAISGSGLNVSACGTFNITASKAGDDHYLPITSDAATVTINKIAQQRLDFTGASNADYNPSAPYALSMSGGSGTGAESYQIAGGAGVGSISGSSLNVSTCGDFQIKAIKEGDANYLPAESQATSVTINRIEQAQLALSSATTYTYNPNTAHALSTTGGSGVGAVTYQITSGTGAGTISGSNMTTTQAGTVSITAKKAQDGHYLEAVSAPVTVSIEKANQTPLAFSSASSTVSDYDPSSPYPLGYTGGDGEGAVSYEIVGGTGAGSVVGSSLNVDRCGTFGIKVHKAGDVNYLDAESVASTIQINKIAQSPISFTSAATADYNPDGAYPISISGGSGTGAVTYAITGGTGTGAISGSGLNVSACGTFNITASKAGDDHYLPITSDAATVTINKIAQQRLDFTGASNVDYNPSAAYALSMSGGSGTGAESYQITGGTGAGLVSGSSLNVSTCGTFQIKAIKEGDANYLPAESQAASVTINRIQQAQLSVSSSTAYTYNPSTPYALSTTGGNGVGTVTYQIKSGTGAGTISGNSMTATKAGTVSITAKKAQDGHYLEAVSAPVTVNIGKANQAPITFSSSSSTVYSAIPYSYTIVATGGTTSEPIVYSQTSSTDVGVILPGSNKITTLKSGSVVIVASKAGDDLYLPVSGRLTLNIQKAQQQPLYFTGTNNYTYLPGSPYLCTSSGGSGTGNISYTLVSGSGTGTINGNLLTVTKAGSFVLNVTKAGDECYNALTSNNVSVNIAKANQNALGISANTSSVPYLIGGSNSITLSSSGGTTGGAVTYSLVSGADKASITGNTLTFNTYNATVGVRATMAGNNLYNSVNSDTIFLNSTYVAPQMTIGSVYNGGNETANVNSNGTKNCSASPSITVKSASISSIQFAVVRTSSVGGYTSKSTPTVASPGATMKLYPGDYTVYYRITDAAGTSVSASSNFTVSRNVTAEGRASTGITGHDITFTYNVSNSYMYVTGYSYYFNTASGHSGNDTWYVKAGSTTIDSGSASKGKTGNGSISESSRTTSMTFNYHIDDTHGEGCLSSNAGYTVNLILANNTGSSDNAL